MIRDNVGTMKKWHSAAKVTPPEDVEDDVKGVVGWIEGGFTCFDFDRSYSLKEAHEDLERQS